jgi:dipeptidyl-peptidase 4
VNQRLAQLGFIVIQIGNRGGSPLRSNAYHSYGYYNLRDYGLADKKYGIEQLAARHPGSTSTASASTATRAAAS